MEVIRGLYNIKLRQRDCVMTIGNFDGVHLGHVELLNELKAKAKVLHKPTLVLTFEPQPNEYFAKEGAVPRLMRFREKVTALQDQGIDYLLCLPFNADLSRLTAVNFIELLVAKLAPAHILVGDDFHFGYQRAGDFTLLQILGQQYHFTTASLPTYMIGGERVSSSRIRQELAQGNLSLAMQLLGHPFNLSGKVARGDQRGRLLGFPTANIHLHRKKVPISGVFAVKMFGVADSAVNGVANVGIRPTLAGGTKVLLEVHLFDFDQDIYDHRVTVQFLQKIRDEQRFPNLSALQAQIADDVRIAKGLFEAES